MDVSVIGIGNTCFGDDGIGFHAIQALEKKLQTKNEVLSELMEEHVKLKKNLGEL